MINNTKTNQEFILKTAAILISAVVIIYGMYMLRTIMIPMCFAFIFSILMLPLCINLEKIKVPRIVSIFISLLVILLFLSGLGYSFFLQMSDFKDEIPLLSKKLSELLISLTKFSEKNFNFGQKKILTEFNKNQATILQELAAYVGIILGSAGNFGGSVALVVIFMFCFLYYRDFFKEFLHKIFTNRRVVNQVLGKITNIIYEYLKGVVVVIIFVAMLNSTGLWLLGVEHGLFFGTFVAFLLIIPYVGILLGSIFPIIYALLVYSVWHALGVAAILIVVQIIEGNFITPYIVGSKVSVNAFIVIFMSLLAEQLWGISGVILATPIVAVIKIICDNIISLRAVGFLLGEAEFPVKQIQKDII